MYIVCFTHESTTDKKIGIQEISSSLLSPRVVHSYEKLDFLEGIFNKAILPFDNSAFLLSLVLQQRKQKLRPELTQNC